MGALPDHYRTPAGTRTTRRAQDAPALAAIPTPPTTDTASSGLGEDLPGVLARAVQDAPRTESPSQASEPAPEADSTGALELAEGRTEADVQRSIRWLGVTYRPPDLWRERQPSLAEEWAFAMAGEHLPERGPWRAAARAYAAPALGLISLLHGLIWVLRSPARHATAWGVAAVVVITAVYLT